MIDLPSAYFLFTSALDDDLKTVSITRFLGWITCAPSTPKIASASISVTEELLKDEDRNAELVEEIREAGEAAEASAESLENHHSCCKKWSHVL